MKKSLENYIKAVSPKMVAYYLKFNPDEDIDLFYKLIDKGFTIKECKEERLHIHISQMFL
jgi:hypothetical protein